MPNFRLMTLNIAHGRGLSLYQGFHSLRGIQKNLQRIAATIREAGPDVVAMQEVDESSHWNKHLHLLEHIRETTGYPYCSVGVHNRRQGAKPLAYGNAILARHPLQDVQTYPFGTRSLGEKGFMIANILTAHGLLPLINLHLDYKSRRVRLEQVRRIEHFIREHYPKRLPLVCGDFNAQRRSTRDAVHRLFENLSRDAHYTLFPERARTWPAHFPSFGIDFVFLPPGVQPLDCQVLPAFVSDHRPVVVDFKFA